MLIKLSLLLKWLLKELDKIKVVESLLEDHPPVLQQLVTLYSLWEKQVDGQ